MQANCSPCACPSGLGVAMGPSGQIGCLMGAHLPPCSTHSRWHCLMPPCARAGSAYSSEKDVGTHGTRPTISAGQGVASCPATLWSGVQKEGKKLCRDF